MCIYVRRARLVAKISYPWKVTRSKPSPFHDGFLAFNLAITLTRERERERLATCRQSESNWSDELSVGYHLAAAVGSCVG